MIGFPVGLLAFGWVLAKAKPRQRQKRGVEGNGVEVSPICNAPQKRQGVHWPIKTQHVRAQEEPNVHGGEEKER